MPAQARKTAKKTAKPAPQAAAAEALEDTDVQIDFRGEKFPIKQATRRSFRYAMAVASGSEPQMIWEMIEPADRARFIDVARPGESFVDVATEFFAAYAEASGQGNY